MRTRIAVKRRVYLGIVLAVTTTIGLERYQISG